jgi:hypothetical protein
MKKSLIDDFGLLIELRGEAGKELGFSNQQNQHSAITNQK